MASKSKARPSKQEAEIEKCRNDAEWTKALELVKLVKASTLETFVKFVVAESKLEQYLSEHPPNDKNIPKAQEELLAPERQLNDVLHSNPAEWIKLESTLLLAKINYVMGDYKAALSKFEAIGLENLTITNITNRRLKLIGEAFAVKGLCLDKVLPPGEKKHDHASFEQAITFGLCLEKTPAASTSKFKLAEREEQIIKCFEKSGDISLVQLQEKHNKGHKSQNSTASTMSSGLWSMVDLDTTGVGPIVETAIQRSPILYIRNGELSKGIGRFRELLRTVETRAVQGLRQTLARQLAEVLLRGVCRSTYEPVPPIENTQNNKKPAKYTGDNLYMPKNQSEECLLLLLISESVATREAILNRSPEFTEARLHTFHNTTAVYDLLTIALVKRAQFSMLSETFERAMKFSFDEYHIWYQFALSLICAEKYGRAILVLQECLRLRPKEPVVLLQAAKLCYEHLGKVDRGLEYSKQCVDVENNRFVSKAYISLGVGYSLKADEAKLQIQRQEYQKQALNQFLRAKSLDSNDYLAEYHVALQMAQLRQITDAMKHVRRGLKLRSDHVHSLHLLALLLSAQKQYSEALGLIEAAVHEYPDNFSLLFTKSKLEEVVYGPEEALQTCRNMMTLWKKMFEPILDSEHRGTGLIDRITTSHRSLVQLQLTEFSDRDSGSIRAESLAASRVEQALSEVASSIGSTMIPRQGPQQTWMLQTQIWLHLAEMYLNLENCESAFACITEAGNIYPFSHMVSFMRGCLHEQRAELQEAKQCFENSISINPNHIRSLQHLGVVLHKLGNGRMAEKVLRDAVNADPTSSQNWNYLGQVLQSLEDYEAGGECMMTAVELEATNPIIPFSNLPKTLE